ncbi:hypothetical protein BDW67DRAFT_79370 [Aspergillus spinulosporus]
MQRRLQGSSSCLFHAPALPSPVSLSSSLIFPSPSAPPLGSHTLSHRFHRSFIGTGTAWRSCCSLASSDWEDHVGDNLLILVLDFRFAHVKIRPF